MGITTTIPTNLDFPNRGVLERDAFVLAQETAQDLLAGGYTTALNQYAVELNATQTDINTKAEQVANQAVTGSYSQAYIDATFTPKILSTQTAKTTPVDADLIPLSDSASSFGLKKLSWANIKATLISSFGVLISGLTVKATPIDADMIVIADSASSNASKKLTWANIKAALKTYFDTLYMALTGNQTIDGVKTFSSSPIVPTPTTTGNIITMGNILEKTAVGIGYGSGSGGTVTQLTSKSTNVTLNKPTGQVVMSNSILNAGTYAYFNINNALVTLSDSVKLTPVESVTNSANYKIEEFVIVAGAIGVKLTNISGTNLSEAYKFNFTIIKGALA